MRERAGYSDAIANTSYMFEKLKAKMAALSRAGTSDPMVLWQADGTPSVSSVNAMAAYYGWVYACIRAISEEIASMKIHLIRVTKNGKEEIEQHPLLDLLEAVNSTQSGFELRYLTAAHLESVGNAYWYLEGVSDKGAGMPKAIHIMPPQKVAVIDNGAWPARATEYRLQWKDYTYNATPEQVIHIKYPNPSDPVRGIGTVQTIATWIDADELAMEFNKKFFSHGARLGGVLEHDGVYSEETVQILRRNFERMYASVENAYRTAILPKGTKFTGLSQTQKDMDFSNLMIMMRDRILAGFRVPRTALGITDDVNRANAEATDYVFALRTIRPKMQLIVSQLNEHLTPRYGDDLMLTFEDPVPENRTEKMAEMSTALGGQPSMTVNEAREHFFNLPPVQNGDNVMTDMSKVPLGEVEDDTDNAEETSEDDNEEKRVRRSKSTYPIRGRIRAAIERKEAVRASAKRLAERAAEVIVERYKTEQKAVGDLSDDQWEPIHKVYSQRVENAAETLVVEIRNNNARQRATVLANLDQAVKAYKKLNKQDRQKGVSRTRLLSQENEREVLTKLVIPFMVDLAEKEGEAAGLLVGVNNLSVITPDYRKALERIAGKLGETYTDTTVDLLVRKINEGLESGASIDQLAKSVSEVYDYSDNVRATTVARTEMFRVAGDAQKEAWRQSGVVQTVKWYTAADERVCPYCGAMHGRIVSVDSPFIEKGASIRGTDGSSFTNDYLDVQGGALHPNCRCQCRPDKIVIPD